MQLGYTYVAKISLWLVYSSPATPDVPLFFLLHMGFQHHHMEKTGNSIWEYACWDCWRTRLNLPQATQKNETLKRCLTCWCGECKNVKNVFFAWCCIKGLVIQGIQPPVLLLLNWPAWPNSCDRLTDTPPLPARPLTRSLSTIWQTWQG